MFETSIPITRRYSVRFITQHYCVNHAGDRDQTSVAKNVYLLQIYIYIFNWHTHMHRHIIVHIGRLDTNIYTYATDHSEIQGANTHMAASQCTSHVYISGLHKYNHNT